MLNILGLAFSFLKKLHYLFYQYKRIFSKLFFLHQASHLQNALCNQFFFFFFVIEHFFQSIYPLNLGKSEGWMFIIFFRKERIKLFDKIFIKPASKIKSIL